MAVYEGNATREEMKAEALKRIEALGLEERIVRNFRDDDKLMIMESEAVKEGCFRVADEALQKEIEALEEEYGFLIYHVLLNDMPMYGEIRTMLFVTNEADTWQEEVKEMLETGFTYAYVDSIMENGVGGVVIEVKNGLIYRIG